MVLPRSPAFRTIFTSQSARAAGARASSRISSRCQQLGRRTYASEGGHGTTQKSSDLPWALGAIAITVPSAFLMLNSGPEKISHGHEKEQVPKGVSEEEQPEEKPEEEAPAPEAEPEAPKEEPEESKGEEKPKGEERPKPAEDERPSDYDPPEAIKPIDGAGKTPGAMSAKQEGLDNADTGSPMYAAPGKSEKGEGEIDTAKVKGAIATDRPQK